jgi:DNA-binding LytR/AlgR family response regulator
MTISAVLVDDELPALEELAYFLGQQEDFNVLETYTDPVKALIQIVLEEPDVVFLDVNMPEMDGFTLAEQLMKLKRRPLLVFVTAYDQYAIRAFSLNAVDYILKPIMQDRFSKTLDRLRDMIAQRTEKSYEPVVQMLTAHRTAHPITKLPLWKGDRIHLVPPAKIIYCEATDEGTVIHCPKDTYLSQDTLGQLEDLLEAHRFFRCHRSFLINLDMVDTIIPWFNNTYAVKLAGTDAEIPVSRRNIKAFKELFHL